MQHRVAVLGSGTMGTALGAAVATAGRACVMWSADGGLVRGINESHRNPRHFSDQLLPPALAATASLEEALAVAELAIVAARSDGVRALAQRIAAFVSPELVLLSATTGLEPQTNKRMSQLLKEENPALAVGAISGPNITQDIMAHRPTGIVVTSERNGARARAVELIELPLLRSFGRVRPPRRRVPGRAQERRRHRRRAWPRRQCALVSHHFWVDGNPRARAAPERATTFTGLAGFGDLFVSSTGVYFLAEIEAAPERAWREIVEESNGDLNAAFVKKLWPFRAPKWQRLRRRYTYPP